MGGVLSVPRALWGLKQWKRGRTRLAELRRRGVGRDLAAQTAGSPHGPRRLSNSPALALAFRNAALAALGLPLLVPTKPINLPNRRVRTRTHGGVGGWGREAPPIPIRNNSNPVGSGAISQKRSQPTQSIYVDVEVVMLRRSTMPIAISPAVQGSRSGVSTLRLWAPAFYCLLGSSLGQERNLCGER
jgi:hypothetical protein